ncbi:unnamed protein product [Clonostachys rhizophaga]|uniref:Uncharacterized protein n=1 Tax=Clonostachys rhizophaga TaxID=160324 RepID=A0A9N9VTV7_9HYPO|nr:unnamed protein product [Clonostachys rhizophaga]
MDSSNNNLLVLVPKINNCRKTIERHVADMDVSLQVTARGSAVFNNAIREGVEYKTQLQRAAGFYLLNRDIKKLYPVKGQSYEKDQETAPNAQATYYIPPNVLTCTLALNMGKGQWPVIVLSLMAEAARIHKESAAINFETFKKWRWVYDRLTNAMVLTKAFEMKNSHEEVNTWSSEKQRQFLEAGTQHCLAT